MANPDNDPQDVFHGFSGSSPQATLLAKLYAAAGAASDPAQINNMPGINGVPLQSPTADISKNVGGGKPPATAPFDLVQAMAQYTQPYTNMMDQLLGSTPGKAPTVAQAETAGMSMLGPFLQGLPAGLASTLTKAIQPEFAAYAGLPTAIAASVNQAPQAGLLTDLVSAAKNQLIYGTGIGTPTPPGALGSLLKDVSAGGAAIGGLAATSGVGNAGTGVAATPNVPGG
jgi:hypothetical protein